MNHSPTPRLSAAQKQVLVALKLLSDSHPETKGFNQLRIKWLMVTNHFPTDELLEALRRRKLIVRLREYGSLLDPPFFQVTEAGRSLVESWKIVLTEEMLDALLWEKLNEPPRHLLRLTSRLLRRAWEAAAVERMREN
jgi:hypothetical protein